MDVGLLLCLDAGDLEYRADEIDLMAGEGWWLLGRWLLRNYFDCPTDLSAVGAPSASRVTD